MKDTNSSISQNASNGSPSVLYEHMSASRSYYWFVIVYLVLLSALGSFVNDMYTPALPAMTRFFHCSIPTVQMGMTLGMAGLATGQFLLGPVSDRYGRKPVLVASVLLFIVAAVASVFSPTIHVFIICRFFQGLGASGGYFLARTIPADIYSGQQLAKIMALIGAINGIAPASAPVIGGVTADAWGWKGIFLVLAAFAAIILLVSFKFGESLPPSRRFKGSWEESLKGYLVLLRNKAFFTHICFKGTALGLLFAYIAAAPFILQDHYGLSQTLYGVVVGVNSVFVAIGSMIALRFKPLKRAAFIGSLILIAGTGAQCFALWFIRSFWLFEIFMAIMLFALGMIFTASNTLAMNEGRQRAGEASSLLGISGYIVGGIVSPLVGVGNVFHSTAIVLISTAAVVLIFSMRSRSLAPDL